MRKALAEKDISIEILKSKVEHLETKSKEETFEELSKKNQELEKIVKMNKK